jgi:hypothetical protein
MNRKLQVRLLLGLSMALILGFVFWKRSEITSPAARSISTEDGSRFEITKAEAEQDEFHIVYAVKDLSAPLKIDEDALKIKNHFKEEAHEAKAQSIKVSATTGAESRDVVFYLDGGSTWLDPEEMQ